MTMRTNGPGKYDGACTAVREATEAELVVLIVLGGTEGAGFSVQALDTDLLVRLPDMLENTARQIRAQTEADA